ncbi:SGNH/GDSL hydrolase family protein [Roseiconus nitratireducens]|uniref:SGNH/GDSL hydrolase family protein n=1 Tax=Roseiconus nitratireducens TaxID=2605748 RepID=A0A5M6D8C2_9BACT|nr:SGNH/GDSL hydrolase family protein [Roseiconus nitratireducens]KAA5541425.1 SGNH/GDSL hydrolase family protein [Roseiconus nitratireducens]
MAKRKPSRWRLVALLVAAGIVLAFTLGVREYKYARPVGTGPAGPDVPREPFASTWTERPVHVLGVGDSITAGLGARSKSHRYFNRVLQNPNDEFQSLRGVCLSAVLPNLTSNNVAISGSESSVHLDVIADSVPDHDEAVFGIVLMTSGGNDLIHMYGRSDPRECAMYGATHEQAKPWIANFRLRLDSMFAAMMDRFPGGCEIYIADIYDPTDGQGDAPSVFLPDWPDGLAIHAEYNQAIREAAGQWNNVFVVPLHRTFLGHGSHCRQWWLDTYRPEDPHYWFYSNIEDPNDRGYDAIRRVFLNAIVQNTSLRNAPDESDRDSESREIATTGSR